MDVLAFQIEERHKKAENLYLVGGRAIAEMKTDDELFFLPAEDLNQVRISKIIFWNQEIEEITPPHTCYLLIETRKALGTSTRELFVKSSG